MNIQNSPDSNENQLLTRKSNLSEFVNYQIIEESKESEDNHSEHEELRVDTEEE